MAKPSGDVPDFDGLLTNDQPKDTVIILAEDNGSAAADHNNADPMDASDTPQDAPDNTITLYAHWVVLWSLSSYFRAKVRIASYLPAPGAGDYSHQLLQ
jgi:hypothetical protein